jgi:hypothetical protein
MLPVLIAQAVDSTSDSYEAGYAFGRILGVILIATLAFLLIRKWRERRQASQAEQRPQTWVPVRMSMPAALATPPPAPATLPARPAAPPAPPAAPPTPPAFDTSRMEAELEGIYRKLGAPQGIEEAKGKVKDLARRLTANQGIGGEEALYQAYEVSLDEHRDYLASQQAAVS